MDLSPKNTRPAVDGPEQWFTGQVHMQPVVSPQPPDRPGIATVTFSPGARTNWHTHPAGQTLIILDGEGRAQTEGQPVRALFPGDVVWFAAGERHWHGAAPGSSMTHTAIHAAKDGRTVDWQEPVAESDYLRAPEN